MRILRVRLDALHDFLTKRGSRKARLSQNHHGRVVIPDKDTTIAAAQLDMNIMYTVAARERSKWQ